MKRYCLTLELINDPDLIKEYELLHQQIWPEIHQSIIQSGIERMEIYRFSNRLMMVIEVNATFSFEEKSKLDAVNEKVQEWENLMWKYQQPMQGAKPTEKWMLMERIFNL